jgi:hypothetical protein
MMGKHTRLVIESPYLPTVLANNRFENISHAHLNHFTMRALDEICAPLRIGIEAVERVDTDGGSFVATFRKGVITPQAVLDCVSAEQIETFLGRMRANGQRLRQTLQGYGWGEVVGYGAGAKGPFLLSLYALGHMLVSVVDDNPLFHGQYLAGTGTRIVSRSVLDEEMVKAILILAPTHVESIRATLPPGKTVINVI